MRHNGPFPSLFYPSKESEIDSLQADKIKAKTSVPNAYKTSHKTELLNFIIPFYHENCMKLRACTNQVTETSTKAAT